MPDEAKVATEHDGANDAIDALREIARMLKELGDENLALERERDAAREHADELERIMAGERDCKERLEEWTDLLQNFRQGVIEKDELLAATVGRLATGGRLQ